MLSSSVLIAPMLMWLTVQSDRKPNWIWAPGIPIPARVLFRRDLDLSAKPDSANLKITCDDAYQLYVNGHRVAHHASWYTMQSVDLRPLLHSGHNVLAVDARNFQGAAGLLVNGEVRTKSGLTSLASGSDWKFSLAAPDGWREPAFEDSAWSTPQIIGPLGIVPWNMPIDESELLQSMQAIRPIAPTKKLPPNPDSVDLARGFQWPPASTTTHGPFQQMRIDPVWPRMFTSRVFTKPTSFVVDFGREIAGWVTVSVESKQQPDLEIQVGEADNRFETPDVVASGGPGHYKFQIIPTGGFTGFRYARIRLTSLPTPARITSVSAHWRLRPANYLGSFSCNDDTLNRIWEMGAYSVRLNLDPEALGAILLPDRGDRYPWMGDDRVAHRTLCDCFGDYDLAKADLNFFVKPGQRPIDVNDIPGYTLDWIIGLFDYWMYSGDSDEIRRRLPDVGAILAQYDTTDTPKGWLFTDWEPELQSTTDKSVTAYHVKYVHAALAAETMAKALGDPAASSFRELARKRLAFLQQRSDWPGSLPQHALTNAILAGLTTKFPMSVAPTTTTPYFTYYVLEALSKAGQDQRALDSLRAYWGGMLLLGATTTWEYFLPEWAKRVRPHSQPPDINGAILSLCHPWSSGATAWLSDHVLGITPVSPGFGICQIKPFFGKLTWAKGSVPTPHGVLHVSWKQSSSGPSVSFSSPAGVRVDLVLPGGFRYTADGAPTARARLSDGTYVFKFTGGGPHVVAAAGRDHS